ncbi:MAG: hypothetical protein AMXMBFR33_33310 [Candidatus Xenobia bacterium]
MDFLMKFTFLQRLFGRQPVEKDQSRGAAPQRPPGARGGGPSAGGPPRRE